MDDLNDIDVDEVSFEVAMKADGKLWTVTVGCKGGLTDQEFAGALICLAEDISAGKVDFNEADTVEGH